MKDTFGIGAAIEAIKNGFTVSRSQWFDKEHIQLQKGKFNYAAAAEEAGDMGTFLQIDAEPSLMSIAGVSPKLFDGTEKIGTEMPVIWHLNAESFTSMPWFPTHADLLAEDYYIVER